MKRPKILVLAGSIRTGALSQKLADAYVAELANHDCEITRISLKDYDLPIMNEDLQEEKGVPENAVKLAAQFSRHDAIVIVSPEYNGSLPPLLKNAIDWMSRVSGDGHKAIIPFRNKVCAVATSSGGVMGGISCLGHLRQILVRLGMLVISEQLSLGNADKVIDDRDRLTNDRSAAMLSGACTSLVEKARLLG